MDNSSINVLEEKYFEKQFNNNLIKLVAKFDSILIIIQINSNDSYESIIKKNELNKLFTTNKSIEDLIELLLLIIEQKKINIKINENNLKLIFTTLNIELTLNKKSKSNEEMINILFQEINYLKKKNNELNEKIIRIENEYKLQNNEKIKIEQNEKKINEMNERIKILEELYSKKILKEEENINILNKEENETFHLNQLNKKENSITLQKLNKEKEELKSLLNENESKFEIFNSSECVVKLNKKFQFEKGILSISLFPSGNIITISSNELDFNMKIWDINLNNIETINDSIKNNFIKIKDENNFISFSYEYLILKYWTKKNNKFENQYLIKSPHIDIIYEIIFYKNYFISCSKDSTIKIWDLNNNKINEINTLKNFKSVNSILLIQDLYLLISSGDEGTSFWNIFNFPKKIGKMNFIKNVKSVNKYTLKRIDKNNILICDNKNKIYNISLTDKNIIWTTKLNVNGNVKLIKILQDKEICLILDSSQNIKIFRCDTFDCINDIQNAHEKDINGIKILNNNSFISYSLDGTIKFWEISNIKLIK